MKNKTFHKKKILVVFLAAFILILYLIGRLVYLMVFDAEYYQQKAEDLHERERDIKAARGEIIDRNGTVLATNRTVCTISVIHSQIENPEKVIEKLSEFLEMDADQVRKKVEKISSIERIRSNVDKRTGDKIRNLGLAGVKVDEDFKRYYPYNELASKVLGFTGGDNQGIVGLEVKYEKYLKGINGKILTTTDARGIELDGVAEDRLEPEAGNTLRISLDYTMQKYALQMAEKVRTEKQADKVGIILMNPQNGEIYAMVNVPEFDLNQPFMLNNEETGENLTDEQRQDALNQMWRNGCINDTYEPGSTFKIITASAGLEEGAVHLTDQFSCPGYKVVEDRRIRCHKVGGHGAENFVQGIQNSCNPVFIEVGLRIGVDRFFDYFRQFGLMDLTGVDIPGEAGTIMHKKENVGQVELATISFGQSFQITPIQLATTVSALVNGGRRVTPHFGMEVLSAEGKKVKTFRYNAKKHIVSEKTSQTMQELLESVVAEGSGKNAYVEGYRIGGKTATSQTLPRSANKYISSFVGFAPADDPQILGMCVIYNPQGVYYGGTIAAPVIGKIFENILPYLGIEKQ
ncbi:peptidoglycan D,D-transpeptidase FtsI family protein [Dorea longicatena]|uniref:Peptidoglycan glycosyltransferase n=1 Tax=Dorea longicatena TaxID=88431 RepID=A0A6L8S1W0_9FIRM|nr:penicillin-binding transpeptidase domain-containing protein [Dorea longicatena]MZK25279.1 peptidoglycan glycosyltransferase [Dorea longicatena]MZK32412.1 peptidoglycan glycosyltransferase [Dorea longicatena]MZK41626.1 peptidoglycan glycosyltransferase [Dorea longicatena]RYT30176.1 peptidoglycan glycosyltransferase [Dorea longicatena]